MGADRISMAFKNQEDRSVIGKKLPTIKAGLEIN